MAFCAGILLAGECGLRLWDAATGRLSGSLYEHVVPVGSRFKMRPSTTIVVPERYGDIAYRFNGRGYRDEEHVAGGPAPVVLLGDSVTFGLGVRQESIYPGLLERRTGEDVVNLAMWAYHTCDELEALEEDGLGAAPRLVVQFYMNDLAARPKRSGASPSPSLRDRVAAAWNRTLYASNLWRRLNQGFGWLSYRLLHDARRRWMPGSLNAAEPRDKLTYLEVHPDDAVPAFGCLLQIARRSQEAGARTLVVASPDEVQIFDDRYDAIGARVAAFCQRNDIAFLDPLPALRKSSRPEDLFLDGVHLSPRGHALLAELLAPVIERAVESAP